LLFVFPFPHFLGRLTRRWGRLVAAYDSDHLHEICLPIFPPRSSPQIFPLACFPLACAQGKSPITNATTNTVLIQPSMRSSKMIEKSPLYTVRSSFALFPVPLSWPCRGSSRPKPSNEVGPLCSSTAPRQRNPVAFTLLRLFLFNSLFFSTVRSRVFCVGEFTLGLGDRRHNPSA